jgi:hypothetical protein
MTNIGQCIVALFSRPGKRVINIPKRILRMVYFMLIHRKVHWNNVMTNCINSALWEPLDPGMNCRVCYRDHTRSKPTVYQLAPHPFPNSPFPKPHWTPCVPIRIGNSELNELDIKSSYLVHTLFSEKSSVTYLTTLCIMNGMNIDDETLPEDDGFYTKNKHELIAKLMKI